MDKRKQPPAIVLQRAVTETVSAPGRECSRQGVTPPPPSWGNTLCISAAGCRGFELWASVLYLHLFRVTVKVFSDTLGYILLRGYFWVWGRLQIFPYKFTSSFYPVSTYERFHRNLYFQTAGESCMYETCAP